MAQQTYAPDQAQDDTDTGFLAYAMEHPDEFRIAQIVRAFQA